VQFLKRIGFLVNPIAGMGGSVGLKGTDGAQTAMRAAMLGARPQAIARGRLFLKGFSAVRTRVEFVTCPAGMGGDAFAGLGLSYIILPGKESDTSSEDTKRAAKAMEAAGVAVIAFCGGDGTARDVLYAVDRRVPAVGIPAGVKMQSGVFAVNPEAAADGVVKFLWDELPLKDGEVADVDEDAFREGRLSSRLYGYLSLPYEPESMQGMKAATPLTDETGENQRALAKWVVESMEDGVIYILGPGSTVKAINTLLGIDGSLLGVDLVLDRKLLLKDADEKAILKAMAGKRAQIIVSPIGNQGFIFGRGNQQISSRVLAKLERERVLVISTRGKLNGIDALRVDTGDPLLDRELRGSAKVLVDYNIYSIKRIL
jgi:predicted polyphosphate/ATP-dependent NAD kinase